MTSAQLSEFRLQLEALRRELTGHGPMRIEPNRTSENEVGDNEDEQPLNEMLQAIASNRNRATDGILARVDRALTRLREDPEEFGVCPECGDDIPLGRLRLMPYVECCVECQSRLDGPAGRATRKKLTDYR